MMDQIDIVERSAPQAHSAAYDKWGESLRAGFQIVPNVLIRGQSKLGLDTVDLAILLNITLHWWEAGQLPHPRLSIIANRIGVSRRTVERRVARLEEAGLIERLPSVKSKGGLTARPFALSGLVAQLKMMSEHNLALREEKRAAHGNGA